MDNKFSIKVGSLGYITFPKGYYLYIGSGGRNVLKRVARHFRIAKKRKWHIDYLTNIYPSIDAYVITSNTDEYQVSEYLRIHNYKHISGFGCTDKKSRSHLYYFPSRNDLEKGIKLLNSKYSLSRLHCDELPI